MRALVFLFAIIVSSSSTFAGTHVMDKQYISNGREAIELCVKRFEELSERAFFKEVDRVYVLTTGEQLELLFTRGEVGTFGERSQGYKPYLACGVILSSRKMDFYYLGEPLKDALIEVAGISQISEIPDVQAVDLLYLRDKSGFSFVDGHQFDPSKIEILRGTTLD